METIITRMTGKSVKKSVANERVINTWTENLPDDFYRPIANAKCQNSFNILWKIVQFTSNLSWCKISSKFWMWKSRHRYWRWHRKNAHMYNIHSIIYGISGPMTVSEAIKPRLLDIMIEVLTRLDHDAKFKKHLKALDIEITCHKNLIQRYKYTI